MKRKIGSLLLSLALVFSLTSPFLSQRSMAAETVYFTAVNENLCLLNDETMPFWSGGTLYVPSTVFSSYDLNISYVRDTSAQTAVLYNTGKIIEFDLSAGNANNKLGTYYSVKAVSKNGYVYFPLAFVSNYFGLNYSILDTEWGPMVRVCSDTAILSDSQFVDAASSLMSSRYNSYLQGKKTSVITKPEQNEPPVSGNDTEEDDDAANKATARVMLAVRADEAENISDMLDTLDRYGYKATFFFEIADLEGQDDLLRRITASGHRLGLIQPADSGIDVVEKGNDILRQYTGAVTRMVLTTQADAARAAGYAVYSPNLPAENLGSTSSGRAKRIMNTIEQSRSTVRVLLGSDAVSVSALGNVCTQLRSGKYTVRAVNEVVCT